MEFETVVSVVLGFVVPFVVSWLKNLKWHKAVRVALAGAVSVVAATGSLFVQGELTSWSSLAANAAIIWGVAFANYKAWFQNTDLNAELEIRGPGGV